MKQTDESIYEYTYMKQTDESIYEYTYMNQTEAPTRLRRDEGQAFLFRGVEALPSSRRCGTSHSSEASPSVSQCAEVLMRGLVRQAMVADLIAASGDKVCLPAAGRGRTSRLTDLGTDLDTAPPKSRDHSRIDSSTDPLIH
jgi:hypothetical protein